MNRAHQSPIQDFFSSWIKGLNLSLVFLVLLGIFFGRISVVRSFQERVAIQHSQWVAQTFHFFIQKIPVPKFTFSSRNSIHELELRNRVQQVRIAQLSEKLHTYEQLEMLCASVSARKTERIFSTIYYGGDGWFISDGFDSGIADGYPVFVSGSFIGFTNATSAQKSTILVWSAGDFSLGVFHQRSRAAGILKKERGSHVVDFFEKVSEIKPDDVYLTLGNQKGVPVAVPVALGKENLTVASDLFTKVRVDPIVHFVSGDVVEIERRKYD